MVVESRIQMKAKGLSKHSVEGTDGSFVVSEVGDVCYSDHNLSANPSLLFYSLASLAFQCSDAVGSSLEPGNRLPEDHDVSG